MNDEIKKLLINNFKFAISNIYETLQFGNVESDYYVIISSDHFPLYKGRLIYFELSIHKYYILLETILTDKKPLPYEIPFSLNEKLTEIEYEELVKIYIENKNKYIISFLQRKDKI